MNIFPVEVEHSFRNTLSITVPRILNIFRFNNFPFYSSRQLFSLYYALIFETKNLFQHFLPNKPYTNHLQSFNNKQDRFTDNIY